VRVAFDSRRVDEPHGVGRYARCLLTALRETAAPEAEIVQTHRPRQVDVFHSPWIDGALLRSPCPMVVTLHDLAAVKRRSERLRTGLRPQLRHLAVQRAARVIVSTHALADEAQQRLGIEPERLAVIPVAPHPEMRPRDGDEISVARRRHGLPQRYLVWVGNLEHPDPGRHIARLAAMPRELPLVLVGPTRPWAHELPGVQLTGHVGEAELAAILGGAHALVLACEDPGLGLSAVEAHACGTPVVAFDLPALRELLGDRAVFVEPGDFSALIDAAQAAPRPPAPAAGWTWRDAARATWRVYEQALREAASRARAVAPATSAASPGYQ
jgi:glycosyltransferase involved in cell wall biosynthesis